MKKVISCTNHIELAPFRNLLDRHEIPYLIKNEFAIGALGEIPVNECWPQLWVLDDKKLEQARQLCMALERDIRQIRADWVCEFCGERNASSFELCWHCEALPKDAC